MDVKVIGNISEDERKHYIQRGIDKYGNALEGMCITEQGDEVEIQYQLKPQPFERVRRITGYLVGTLDRWNNAKRAEERDRVKHGV